MAVVRDGKAAKRIIYPSEAEAEGVAFARACRAQLVKQWLAAYPRSPDGRRRRQDFGSR